MAATRNIAIKVMHSARTRTPCNILALSQGTRGIAMDNESLNHSISLLSGCSLGDSSYLLMPVVLEENSFQRVVKWTLPGASFRCVIDRSPWQENVRRNIPQVILKHQHPIPSHIQGLIKKVRCQCRSNLSTCNLVELHHSGL